MENKVGNIFDWNRDRGLNDDDDDGTILIYILPLKMSTK